MSTSNTWKTLTFLENVYNNIFPVYIKSLSQAGDSHESVFANIESLFDTVLELSELSAGFAVFWSDNLNYGEALSIPYFVSPAITMEEFEPTLNAVAEMLTLGGGNEPRVLESPLLPGYTVSIPIIAESTAFGYAVVFYQEKDNYNEKRCSVGGPRSSFLSNAMYITALFLEKDDRSKSFEHFLMNDYLTELPNRTYIYESLVYSLQMADFTGTRFAFMIVHVNGLKHINNSLGTITGDLMLKDMGNLISETIESTDANTQSITGRLSGGDFAVLLTYPALESGEDNGNEIVKAHCEAVIKKMSTPVTINNYQLYPSVSIGASIYPQHGETPETLLRRADLAKSTARQTGHNSYNIYDDWMDGASDKMLFLNNNLPIAIASNQFELFYQAQADAKTGLIVAAEALIRWNHPKNGMIYPGDFIEYAEENGYGIQIDRLVLEMVAQQLLEWRNKGIDLSVSVNISPKHFANGLIYNTIKKILAQTSLDPSCIKVELLESAVLEDFDTAVKVIKSLQDLGVVIALDDFGTGYSSLEYVAMLPLDYLKIDRTFSMNLEQHPSNKTILKTVMTLAEGMGVKTIAEGIETQSQLDFLRSIGCDLVQGYLINKPMPVSEFDVLLSMNKMNKR